MDSIELGGEDGPYHSFQGLLSPWRRGGPKSAAELCYECISREVLLKASAIFGIPELKLTHAIEDAPSLFERLGRDRKKYIAYIRTTLLRSV